MRQSFTGQPGGTVNAQLPNSATIRSVEVDNTSGSWLNVVEMNIHIPPYTKGWKRNLAITLSSITIAVLASPAIIAAGSIQGEPYRVWVSDSTIVDSDGASYASPTSNVLRAADEQFDAAIGGLHALIPAPPAGMRIVIWTTEAVFQQNPIAPPNFCRVDLLDSLTDVKNYGELMPTAPYVTADREFYPKGMPLDIGDGLNWNGQAGVAAAVAMSLFILVTYTIE